MKYNLEERLVRLSENIIDLCKNIPINTLTIPLVNQLLRSGTSIGANYTEANGAASKRDFKNKIIIAKKEAMETKYWLRLITHTINDNEEKLKKLWQETHEVTLIFSKIIRSC